MIPIEYQKTILKKFSHTKNWIDIICMSFDYYKEYPYLIIDLRHNIAVSKVLKEDFKPENKLDYILLFQGNNKRTKELIPDVAQIPEILDDFLGDISIALWTSTALSYDFQFLLNYIQHKPEFQELLNPITDLH